MGQQKYFLLNLQNWLNKELNNVEENPLKMWLKDSLGMQPISVHVLFG